MGTITTKEGNKLKQEKSIFAKSESEIAYSSYMQLWGDGNKLIAEFMCLAYDKKYNQYGKAGHAFDGGTGWFTAAELGYPKSWEWLMPVVEKIEATPNKFGHLENSVQIGIAGTVGNKNNTCTITGTMFTHQEIHGSKIENLWLAVVAFIKRHNELKSKK